MSIVGRVERLRCVVSQHQAELLRDTANLDARSVEAVEDVQARWLKLVNYHQELYKAIEENERTLMMVHRTLDFGAEADKNRENMEAAKASAARCDDIRATLSRAFQCKVPEPSSEAYDWSMVSKAKALLAELRSLDYTSKESIQTGERLHAELRGCLERFGRRRFPVGMTREVQGSTMVSAAKRIAAASRAGKRSK